MGNGKRLVNEWTSKPDLHQKPNCINIFLSVYYRPDIILSDFHMLFNSYDAQETEGPFLELKYFKDLFLFLCECVCACVWMCVCVWMHV